MQSQTLAKRRLVWVLVWMSVIFFLSHQDGHDSGEVSLYVCIVLARVMLDFDVLREMIASFGITPDVASVGYVIEFFVRKAAHMTEYLVLTVLLYRWLMQRFATWTTQRWLLTAWVGAVIYACTDEIHQLFIPGRAGTLFDVGVDATGALIGIALLVFCNWCWDQIKKPLPQ